jgi:hypothetical protein
MDSPDETAVMLGAVCRFCVTGEVHAVTSIVSHGEGSC